MQLKKLVLTGADRQDFLNRQFTADLNALADGQYCLTAWCNIKGRVSTLLWLQPQAEQTVLLVPAETYAKLMPRLGMFVLRDDVQISQAEDCWLNSINAEMQLELAASDVGTSSYDQLVNLGIPYLTSETCDEYLPQSLNLDKLNGLSYAKGCYPGQEIVARTHFRGKLKQRMLKFSGNANTGDSLHNPDGDKVGNVLLGSNEQCLAMVKLAETEKPISTENGHTLSLQALPYPI